jgi:hypothetical protein
MSDDIERRMAELMVIIDQSLLLCDTEQDQLMLACAMLQRTTEIFEDILGVEGRQKMFKELA